MTWKPIKLVRDLMTDRQLSDPEIKLVPVEEDDRGRLLRGKLTEEYSEYMEDRDPWELADIMEACYALAKIEHGIPGRQLDEMVTAKRVDRGGFDKTIGLYVKVRAS